MFWASMRSSLMSAARQSSAKAFVSVLRQTVLINLFSLSQFPVEKSAREYNAARSFAKKIISRRE
jgi:hypothetical protein